MDDLCYGLTWAALFALRDRYARRIWTQHGQQYPLEEYLSQGNLTLTKALRYYRASGSKTFFDVVTFLLEEQLQEVPKRLAPRGTRYCHQGTKVRVRPHRTVPQPPDWPGWETVLHPPVPRQEPTCLAHQVVADLQRAVPDEEFTAWLSHIFGWTYHEIATARCRSSRPACPPGWG